MHEVIVVTTYSGKQWTFYDANRPDDLSRRICTFYTTAGQTVRFPIDVRVRNGLMAKTGPTEATATALFQAD